MSKRNSDSTETSSTSDAGGLQRLIRSEDGWSECRRKLIEAQGLERQIWHQLKNDDPGMSFEAISLNLARARTLHAWSLFWFLVGMSRGSHGNVKKSRSRVAKAGEG